MPKLRAAAASSPESMKPSDGESVTAYRTSASAAPAATRCGGGAAARGSGEDRSAHQGQVHLELRPPGGGALHRDVAAVLAHDPVHDRQPEAGAARAARAERLEDAPLRVAIEPAPFVADRQHQ